MAEGERPSPDESIWQEIRFLKALVDRLPRDRRLLNQLATLYTEHGLFEEGLALDQRLAKKYPDDSAVLYDLACSLTLCGQLDAALEALKEAVSAGYDEAEWMMKDRDLAVLRGNPEFLRLVGRIINGRTELDSDLG